MTVRLASVRLPYARVLLPRTRLAYVHLRNLLTDAKRDRAARVSGYVVVWLPDELVTLYLQHGEVVNATTYDGKAFTVVPIGTAIGKVPPEPEYGEICFHEAEDEQLCCMFTAQTASPDGWPPELRVGDPNVLFPYLMSTTFDGMVEIRSDGGLNYLVFADGNLERSYLAPSEGATLLEQISHLFAGQPRVEVSVRRWQKVTPLRVQASPALIQAYRELLSGLVQRATSAGSSSALAIAEHARQSLLTRHPSLDGFAFSDRPVSEPVADGTELTAAVAAWIQEFMWTAADHDRSSPEEMLRDAVWERRHIFQSAGLFDRIPWKVA
ncbi:MAG: hypothetical protein ABR499_07315 [Gemmatimonadaceae bacterium]